MVCLRGSVLLLAGIAIFLAFGIMRPVSILDASIRRDAIIDTDSMRIMCTGRQTRSRCPQAKWHQQVAVS